MIDSAIISKQLQYYSFGDKRLSARCHSSQAALIEHGSNGSFPQVFKDQHQLKGFYRFINNDKVTPASIVKSYMKGLVAFYREMPKEERPDLLFAFQDTTYLKFHSRKELELGYLETLTDNGLGFHNGLLTDEQFTPLGVPIQHTIIRDKSEFGKRSSRKKRSFEQKESSKWTAGFDFARKFKRQTGIKVCNVFDKEGDSGDVFNYALRYKQLFIVNARANRKLLIPVPDTSTSQDDTVATEAQNVGLLFEHLQALQNETIVERPILDAKGKCHQKKCAIKFSMVSLNGIDRPLNAVELTQIDPIENQEMAHWVLLTSMPVSNIQDAIRVIDIYTHRWTTCEDYHKCLKTGCSIEDRQMETKEALLNVIAMLSIVAVTLLRLRHISQVDPEADVKNMLEEHEVEAASILADKYLKPKDIAKHPKESVAWFLLLLARMGGYLSFNNKGEPGWQTIWKGWNYFQPVAYGVKMSKNRGHGNISP